jgi:hypothetical protein
VRQRRFFFAFSTLCFPRNAYPHNPPAFDLHLQVLSTKSNARVFKMFHVKQIKVDVDHRRKQKPSITAGLFE